MKIKKVLYEQVIKDFISLPSKEAVALYENTKDTDAQSLMKNAIIELHEESLVSVIIDISFRPGKVLDLQEKDIALVKKTLREYRKFHEQAHLTFDNIIKMDLEFNSKGARDEYNKLSPERKVIFDTKIKAIKNILNESF